MSRFAGSVSWPGAKDVPDLRRQPQHAALSVLRAAAAITIHALIAAHPDLERPPTQQGLRSALALAVVAGLDQVLVAIDHYEHHLSARPRRIRPAPDQCWLQVELPFPPRKLAASERAPVTAGDVAP